MTERLPTTEELERTADALGDLARQLNGDVSAEADVAARRRLLASLDAPRSRPVQRYTVAAALLALLGATRYALWNGTTDASPTALTYTTSPEMATAGHAILNKGATNGAVRFSDGSDLEVRAHTHLRIAEVDAQGAIVELDEGHILAEIEHDRDTRWRLDAGDFSIRVVGTVFEADWTPDTGVLEVVLHEGRVEVDVPWMRAPVSLESGQRLEANTVDETVYVGPMDELVPEQDRQTPPLAQAPTDDEHLVGPAPEPTPAPEQAPEPAPTSEQAATPASPPATVPAPAVPSAQQAVDAETPGPPEAQPPDDDVHVTTEPVRTWSEHVAAGDFEQVVAQALATPQVLEEAPLPDLVALADAARYTRNFALAHDALTQVRGRFASSSDARQAAFFLGRLEERQHHLESAVTWYETYLVESPSSRYADQALGRLMLVLAEQGDDRAAGDRAVEYLEAYPSGTYAPAADALVPR